MCLELGAIYPELELGLVLVYPSERPGSRGFSFVTGGV